MLHSKETDGGCKYPSLISWSIPWGRSYIYRDQLYRCTSVSRYSPVLKAVPAVISSSFRDDFYLTCSFRNVFFPKLESHLLSDPTALLPDSFSLRNLCSTAAPCHLLNHMMGNMLPEGPLKGFHLWPFFGAIVSCWVCLICPRAPSWQFPIP